MEYVTQNLQKDERIEATARFSKLAAIPWLIYFIVFLLICTVFGAVFIKTNIKGAGIALIIIGIVFGLLPYLMALWDISKTELVVTNKRVLGKRGIFSMKTVDILLNKVESTEVCAGFWGRITGFYSVSFRGSGLSSLKFVGVKNAEQLKNTIARLS